jgi:hypothetical protein
MRMLIIVAAGLALATAGVTAGAAAAQDRGLAPTTTISGDSARIQNTQGPDRPGPAVRPGVPTAQLGPVRGMPHRYASRHTCVKRAHARGLWGPDAHRYVARCNRHG